MQCVRRRTTRYVARSASPLSGVGASWTAFYDARPVSARQGTPSAKNVVVTLPRPGSGAARPSTAPRHGRSGRPETRPLCCPVLRCRIPAERTRCRCSSRPRARRRQAPWYPSPRRSVTAASARGGFGAVDHWPVSQPAPDSAPKPRMHRERFVSRLRHRLAAGLQFLGSRRSGAPPDAAPVLRRPGRSPAPRGDADQYARASAWSVGVRRIVRAIECLPGRRNASVGGPR
jgi:hypothetical protein